VLDPQAVDDVTGVAYDLPRRTTGQYLLYARRRVSLYQQLATVTRHAETESAASP